MTEILPHRENPAEGARLAARPFARPPASAIDEDYSPKQLARRALIVEAAKETLRRDGVAGCTVRNIAAATPFTKGTMHYYFDDVREIVNTAFVQLTEDYMASVADVAREADDAESRFWRAVESYFEGFHGHPRTGLLWFEYSSWAVRNGFSHGIVSTIDTVRSTFAPHLGAIDSTATDAATGLVRYLFGAVFEIGVCRIERDAVMADLAGICGLRQPAHELRPAHAELCPVCRSGPGKRSHLS